MNPVNIITSIGHIQVRRCVSCQVSDKVENKVTAQIHNQIWSQIYQAINAIGY